MMKAHLGYREEVEQVQHIKPMKRSHIKSMVFVLLVIPWILGIAAILNEH